MSNTSTIHIKTDFDCKVYDYGQELGTTKADTYFNIELRKGEHELTFAFVEDENVSKTITYKVEEADCDYQLIIEIAEALCEKAKQLFDFKDYSSAFSLFTIAAEKGNADAIYYLGRIYCEEKDDKLQAFKHFQISANRGNLEAKICLGCCYKYGYGTVKNWNKTLELTLDAAAKGNIRASRVMGFYYECERDHTKVLEWYTKAAKQGDAVAQNNLAVYNSYNTEERSEVIDWLIKAAEQGNATAQYNLAICYNTDCFGVKKDLTKAVEWYTKSAEQRNASEQCHYEVSYLIAGPDAEEDLIRTVEWHNTTKQRNACELYNLGLCYEHGDGVEKDLFKAVELYTKAAEQGYTEAQYKLASCYESGHGTKEDHDKALELYTIAAESGYPEAQCALGFYYQYGGFLGRFYNEEDPVKAVEWYTKAAEQGYAQAQYNLGHCYECGEGVEKNLSEAVEWYTKAAEQGNEDAKKILDCLKSIEKKTIHYLFFDTETSGLPVDYYTPTYASKLWPRLVQLSWITTDENCNIISQNDFIIYPDGFTIPSDASKLHGITTEIAKEKGKLLKEVMDKFMKDFKTAKAIVGHNIDFDKKILSAELYRLKQRDIMNSKKSICTMKAATDYCKIPGSYGYKWPTLQELHKKLFGCEFEDAHNSMSDVKATLKCFKEMKKLGWI